MSQNVTVKSFTKECLEQLRDLCDKSTRVNAWYPHSQYDGYHSGKASIRGPFGRWLLVEGGESGAPGGKLGSGVADLYDDAKFAAAAMNSMPALLDLIDEKDRKIAELKKEIVQMIESGPGIRK